MNTEKDYYNDLPGKLPPELLQNSELPRKVSQLTIQVRELNFLLPFVDNIWIVNVIRFLDS